MRLSLLATFGRDSVEYNTPERLRRSEAADYLRSKYRIGTQAYLNRLASIGGGPKFERIGHLCLYRREDLDHWAFNRPDGRSSRASNTGGSDA